MEPRARELGELELDRLDEVEFQVAEGEEKGWGMKPDACADGDRRECGDGLNVGGVEDLSLKRN